MSVWDGDEKETARNVVSTGERESNFSGMSHMQRHIGCVCVYFSRGCVCVYMMRVCVCVCD